MNLHAGQAREMASSALLALGGTERVSAVSTIDAKQSGDSTQQHVMLSCELAFCFCSSALQMQLTAAAAPSLRTIHVCFACLYRSMG